MKNEVINVIENRMSLRKYSQKPINEEQLDLIINAAMRAPTAGNMMLYSIIVIKNKETLEILSKTCDNQPFIATADSALIFVADFQKWNEYFILSGINEYEKKRNSEYKKPSKADLMLAISDALIAAQNSVIAAESMNIGSCYIGDIMENFEVHRDLFNLPQYTFPIGMITLGYYEEGYKKIKRERFDKKFVVFNEKYPEIDSKFIKEMFKPYDLKFNPNNTVGALNFAQQFYARKNGAEFFKEMKRSVNLMLEAWEE
jgi:nitroreductase